MAGRVRSFHPDPKSMLRGRRFESGTRVVRPAVIAEREISGIDVLPSAPDPSGSPRRILSWGPIEVHPAARDVYVNDEVRRLTSLEFDLFTHFLCHLDVALEQAEIIKKVLGTSHLSDTSLLRVHISRINKALQPLRPIENVRPRRYMMRSFERRAIRSEPTNGRASRRLNDNLAVNGAGSK